MNEQAPPHGTPEFWRWMDSKLTVAAPHEYIGAVEAAELLAKADQTPDNDGRIWVLRNGVRLKLSRTSMHDDVETWFPHAGIERYGARLGARVYADRIAVIDALSDG